MGYDNLGAYGAFLQAQDRNRAADAQGLQQGVMLTQMQQALAQARKRTMLEQMALEAGGDPQKLMQGYLQMGDAQGASQVAATGETMRKMQEAAQVRDVLSNLPGPRGAAPTMPTARPMAFRAPGELAAEGIADPAAMQPRTAQQVTTGRAGAIQARVEQLTQAADMLRQRGLAGPAMEFDKQAAEVAKMLPKFAATTKEVEGPDGRPMLVAFNDAGDAQPTQFRPAPKEDELIALMRARGIDPASAEGQRLLTARMAKLATHQPAPVNNINVNTEKQFLGNIAEAVGKDIAQGVDHARSAVQTISTLNQIRGALDSGKVTAGPGTTARTWLTQVGQVMGIAGKDAQEQLTKTREVIQGLAQLELNAAQLMKGQGAITEAERSIIRRAASGDIDSMTVPELRILTGVMDKTARFKIQQNSANVQRLRGNPNASGVVDYMSVQEPPAYNPRGAPGPQPVAADGRTIDQIIEESNRRRRGQ